MFPGQTPSPLAPPPAPAPPKFEPKYLDPIVITNPWGGTETLNPIYFATRETAEEVHKLIGGLSVYSVPFILPGGFMNAPVDVWFVRFMARNIWACEQNAGLLADLIQREGVADSKDILKREGIFLF